MDAMTIKKHPICTGCTLLCDDVEFEGNGLSIASGVDCTVAQSFIANTNQFLMAASATTQNVEELSKSICDSLRSADAPLIVGLNHLTTEAQQLAWRIADIAGARIDTTLSKADRSSIYALQRIGKVTASLGEIGNRGDLIVFWFCDPMKTHPRLIERLRQAKRQTKAAVNKRIIVVGDSSCATAKVTDDVFSVSESDAADFIRNVRLALRDGGGGESPSGSLPKEAEQLARLLSASKYGSWFYGHTKIIAEQDDVTLASQKLVRELNDHTRFVSLALREDRNGASGENVLAALGGFPAAVDLSMSIPQYNGAEYAAETVLENGECDFVLLFSGWGTSGEIERLSSAGKAYLAKVPKAVVSSDVPFGLDSEYLVQVDRPGVNDFGEFCRIDDVSIAAGGIVVGELGSATDFLRLVFERLCSN